MKVLLLNGSPRKEGCTYTALCEVAGVLNANGIETEIFQAGDPSYVKKHHEFLDNLFKCGYGHLFLNAIDQYVMYRWKKEDDSLDHIYRLHAFSGALYNSYIHWSLGGARESPEEMAKALRLVFADT